MNYSLGAIESRFADIIWENAPLTTSTLVKLCEKELKWKRTTTYTVLKRLCDRDIFEMKNGIVVTLISREEFYSRQSSEYVSESFHGSLPAFLSAFASSKELSDDEIDEIQGMINKFRQGGKE